MRIPVRISLAAVCASLLITAVSAQRRADEVLRPATPVKLDEVAHRTDLIVVKFVEGHAVRLDADGALTSRTLDIRTAASLIGDRRVERMFTRTVEDLDREKVELERRSGWQLADLNNYYWVHTTGRADSEALLDDLLADRAIETAYPEFGSGGIVPLTPDIPPPTPNFEGRQTYFNPAPGGFGHIKTRAIDGAQGLGKQLLVQLEGAWVMDHEDQKNLVLANVIGTKNFGRYNTSTWYRHGSACVGILNADRNAYGVVGFAPESKCKVSSLANGAANMINLSTAQAKAGDVFTSSFAYVVSRRHAPLDYVQSNFDAVKRATAKGICYTYGAGNSGQNLANTSIYGNRYTATAPQSGGFHIGATAPNATSRISWSNYGPTVIANGWGSGVVTTGYGSLFRAGNDRRQDYTATFGGTSAAGPEVAGVIASLQGANLRQNGKPLTPAQVRTLLKTTGTAVSGQIGKRPNLVELMTKTKAADGLLVTREASVGGRLDLELSAAAGRLFVLFMAADRTGTDVGLNRKLLLQLASLTPILTGRFTGSGKVTVPLTIPSDSSLKGKSVFFQNVDLTANDVHLTNSIEGYIR